MQTITAGYKGFAVLMRLNWDRLLCTAVVVGALYLGAFLALV